MIHASVAFKSGYKPGAVISNELGYTWETINGQGRIEDITWTVPLGGILEMDLFDHSQAGIFIQKIKDNKNVDDAFKRLSFLALFGRQPINFLILNINIDTIEVLLDKGAKAILDIDKDFETILKIAKGQDPTLQLMGIDLLRKAVRHREPMVLTGKSIVLTLGSIRCQKNSTYSPVSIRFVRWASKHGIESQGH
jgi:hypothetical protein